MLCERPFCELREPIEICPKLLTILIDETELLLKVFFLQAKTRGDEAFAISGKIGKFPAQSSRLVPERLFREGFEVR